MANPRKIQPGARIKRFPAGTFNALVDGELRDRQSGHKGNPAPFNGFANSSVIVRLVWDGDTPIPPGSAVKLDEVIKDPTDKAWVVREGLQFRCSEPTSSSDKFAITMEPMVPGGLGYGHIPQAAWALINIGNAGDDYAKLTTSTEMVSDSADGQRIIWKQSGTGSGKWAVVSLGGGGSAGSTLQYAEVTTTVTPGTSWATPGTGTVQPKDIDGLNDGSTIDVVNFRPEQFDVGYIVIFDSAQVDGSSRRLLIDGVCARY